MPLPPLLLLLVAAVASSSTPHTFGANNRRSALFIVFDDLRPDLSMYNNRPQMHTPHLQKLADDGLVFERAYCQQTVCAPSRMSFT